MGKLFKSRSDKEFEKRQLVRRAVKTMEMQIQKLEQQKKALLDKAVEAKKNGLGAQVELAKTGYRMTSAQQRKAQEMLLNFELTAQMKDMTMMTTSFMKAMSVLSEEMGQYAEQQDFARIHEKFQVAMTKANMQAEKLGVFMDMSKEEFAYSAEAGAEDSITDAEFNKLVEDSIIADAMGQESATENDLGAIKKKIEDKLNR